MQKQTIGFDRELELAWLDLVAGMAQDKRDLTDIRHQLQARLAAEIPGQEARRKTVTLLTRLWVRVLPEHQPLRTEALQLLPQVTAPERLWLHWGMSMLAYPVFFDTAATVGQLLKLQGEFEPAQVRRRMRESWGQRTTLDRAIQRLIRTFLSWGVIKQPATGLQICYSDKIVRTENHNLALWFFECTLQAYCQSIMNNGTASVPLATLIEYPAIFPFDLANHLTTLRQSERFEIGYQGLNIEYVSLQDR